MSRLCISSLRSRRFTHAVAHVMLIAYVSVHFSPSAHAMVSAVAAMQSVPETIAAADGLGLESLKEELANLASGSGRQSIREVRARVGRLRAELAAHARNSQDELAAIEAHIRRHSLPESILQRHRDTASKFQSEFARTDADLAAIEGTSDVESLRSKSKAVRDRLERFQSRPHHQPFNPNSLPFKADHRDRRPPKVRTDDFAELFGPEPVTGLRFAATNAMPGLVGSQLASGSVASELLAATEDVQITQAIRELADRLHNNPAEIFSWVRNNIEFVPTYGSIQGSVGTLRSKQGNAFDCASLLIALLRAAGIPSRYVYGTVQIPIDQAMNWVGGAQNANAALDLIAQGGIPVLGLAQGGSIKAARMEHVWVEAYVDAVPSRGAKNLVPDAWIPMDPSFKQHSFMNAMRPSERAVATQLASTDALKSNVTYSASAGTITGITTSQIVAFRDEFRAAAESYFEDAQDRGEEPLRQKVIVNVRFPVLPSGLPYSTVAVGARFAEVPTSLRRSFSLKIYASASAQTNDSALASFTSSLPLLAGKRVSIQFVPATAADAAALRSFMPAPGSDGTIDVAQIPNSIPGYLINLAARVLVDGAEVRRVDGFVLGQEFASTLSIQRVDGTWHEVRNRGTAGEFSAISLDLAGTGSDPLYWDQSATADASLHSAGQAYWANLDEYSKMLQQLGVALAVRQPSFGMFSTRIDPIYSWGVPKRVSFRGVEVDIDAALSSLVVMDGSASKRVQMAQMMGAVASSLEHEIPEVYLSASGSTARGASAISVLGAAVAAGQTLLSVDSHNAATAIPVLQHSSEVIADVRQAVQAGQRVLISQRPATVGNWTGSGYIIEDPLTGSGAYRISGGANGGSMDSEIGEGMAVLGLDAANVKIPASAAQVAASNSCDGQSEPTRQPVVHIDFVTMLFIIMAALIIWGILTAGSGGALAPASIAAIAVLIPLLVSPMNQAMAASPNGQCPTYYAGSTYGTGSMAQATDHIASALSGSSPSELTYLGVDVIEELGRDPWYNKKPECSPAARAAYAATNPGSVGACDEYPFNAVWEGGELNYGPPNNYVSLRLIDFGENSRAGASTRWFYAKCGVLRNGKFKVETTGGPTRGTNAQGAVCLQ